MIAEEKLTILAQQINDGLLNTLSPAQSTDYLVDGLSDALTQERIEVVDEKGKVRITPTETALTHFLSSIDTEQSHAINDSIKHLSGIKLAKKWTTELLKLAQKRTIENDTVAKSLDFFLNQLK